MSSGGPPQDNLDYVLRTVQNPQTPPELANTLFSEYLIPIITEVQEALIAFFFKENTFCGQWVQENALTFMYEELVLKPRATGKSTLKVPPGPGVLQKFWCWLRLRLKGAALDELRKREREVTFLEELEEDEDAARNKPTGQGNGDDLKKVKKALYDGLCRLEKLLPPTKRANGVGYFAVLFLHVWMTLCQRFYKALEEKEKVVNYDTVTFDKKDTTTPTLEEGGKVVNYDTIADWMREFLPPEIGADRRILQQHPTLGEVCAILEDYVRSLSGKFEMPLLIDKLSSLCEGGRFPIGTWRQWVCRARVEYCRLRVQLAALEREVLDSLILRSPRVRGAEG
jgi:hypothetical protein